MAKKSAVGSCSRCGTLHASCRDRNDYHCQKAKIMLGSVLEVWMYEVGQILWIGDALV